MKRFLLRFSVCWVLWSVICPAVYAVKYVTPTGTGGGGSWPDATSLTNALVVAAANEEIWIADGKYTNAVPFEIRTNNVTLYGGFTNGMGTLGERDWTAYPPILDGQAVRRVLQIYTNAILDGLVISNGYATAGAGLYASGSFTVTVRNCRITGCSPKDASATGGGAYCNGVTVFATNTSFIGNLYTTYSQHGLGLYAVNAAVSLVDCVFTNNSGDAYGHRSSDGGALYVSGGSLGATNCVFVNNKIGTSNGNCGGGAGFFLNGAVVAFEGCVFRGNEVLHSAGGGTAEWGGCFYVDTSTTKLNARHCVFDDNRTPDRGGAFYVVNGAVSVVNCTFVTNRSTSAAGEGGAICTIGGVTTVKNSIFYGNTATLRGADLSIRDGYATNAWSRLGGTGNANAYDLLGAHLTLSNVMTNDPLFADAAARDYHLKSPSGRWQGGSWITTDPFPHSPCIDAGNPADSVGEETSPNGSRVNLGRYAGTAEASRSPTLAPVVATRAASTNYNIAILRGELIDNDTIASVTIYYGTSPTVTNTATALAFYPPQQTGTVFEARLTALLYDTDYYFRCYATNAYGEDWADTTEMFHTGVKPAGGPDGVIHVKSDAVGGGSGDCWFNACPSPAQAAARVTAGTNEIWVAGGTYDDATLAIGATCSLYGGFAGTETNRGDRNVAANAVRISGKGERRGVNVTAGTVLLDGLIVTNGYQATSGAGLYASGTYDLTLRNVQVLGCRPNGDGVKGIGAYFNGGSVTMSNCVFRDNRYAVVGGYASSQGSGFYANSANVRILDSRFENNGWQAWETRSSAGGAFYQNGGTLAVTNSLFIGNQTGCDLYGGCGVINGGAKARFMNCVFRNNSVYYLSGRGTLGGGALYVATASTTATVENCTLAANFGAERGGAFYVASGSLTVKNCNLWGNTCTNYYPGTEGYDMVCAGGTLNVSYCNLSGSKDSSTYVYDATGGGLVKGAGLATADPLFASTNDVHEKSKAGRWDPTMSGGAGDWTNDTVTSPCIDAGDGDYINEPPPNGSKLNLGAYGNTWQASKTALVAPVVTNRAFTVNYNYATMRGELVDVDATAEIRIYYGLSDGAWIGYIQPSPALQQTGTVFEAAVGDLLYSTNYYYRCFATNAAGFDWADNLMSFPTGTEPPGGPDTVIHVKTGAAGSQSGVTWFDACHTLADACAKVQGATNEIWVANRSEVVPATVPIATNVSIYGGFLGGTADGETSRAQRSLTNATALNGNNERRIMRITGGTVLLDGLTFTNGLAMDPSGLTPYYRGSGLYASGGGNLTLANCVFSGNGTFGQRNGSGAFLEGGTVLMTNCVFTGNYRDTDGWSYGAAGHGFYGSGAAIVALDCLFTNNGVTGYAGRTCKGGAFFLNGGTFSATNCVFADNKTGTDNTSGGGCGAIEGTVTARFVNCVFRGNSSDYRADRGGAEGGVFRMAAGSGSTVTVQNCTLAFNTAGGTGGGSWVSGGTLVLTNSILWSNQIVQAGAAGTEIAALGAASRVSSAYTDFTGTNGNYVVNGDGNATIAFGAGVMVADPLFAGATDLHLKSRAGRWDPALNGGAGGWTKDSVTSPCIDAGAPGDDYSNEPNPNGKRVNLGAYGNTPFASKSLLLGSVFIVH